MLVLVVDTKFFQNSVKIACKGAFYIKKFQAAKVVKIVWGLIILYCTIKTRMIYFCVATLSKAQNWRIYIKITIKIRQEMVLVYIYSRRK